MSQHLGEGWPVAPDIESPPDSSTTASDRPRSEPPERGYCRLHRPTLPLSYPTQPRPDLPIRYPLVVATRPGEELLCNCEHTGPHLWPNGDESGDWPDQGAGN